MKKTFTCCMLLCIGLGLFIVFPKFIYSQALKVEIEDARLAEFLKKKYPKENAACKYSELNYSFNLEDDDKGLISAKLEVEEEMIGLKEKQTFSKVEFYNSESKVGRVRAYDYRNSVIRIVPIYKDYQENGIFYSDAKICYFEVNFETRGELFSYHYGIDYNNAMYLPTVLFSENYPIEERVVTFEIPNNIELDFMEKNFEGYDIKKTEEIKSKSKIITYTVYNLPPLSDDNNAPSFMKYAPHIVVVNKSYKKDNISHGIIRTVDDLYKWYNTYIDDKEVPSTEVKDMVKKLTADKKTDLDKIEAIFYWVQESIRYIAFENGIMAFKPEKASKVFSNRYGDCKGMANLMREMLTIAGFDARLTWIGTNGIPYDHSIKSPAADNHMICTLILDGKHYFLDATEDFIAFNDYAHRIQGREVLIRDGAKPIIDRVPEFPADRNKLETSVTCTLRDDIITGTVTAIYNGEEKTVLLRGYSSVRNEKKEDALRDYIQGGDKNMKITVKETSDFKERTKPLVLNYDYEWSNQVLNSGKEYYINIEPEKIYGKFDFDSTRTADYEFDSKKYYSSKTEFIVPQGFKIDYLPAAIHVKAENYTFNLEYKQQGDRIIYTKEIIIPNAVIKKADFKAWNKDIKNLRKFYNDQIVLIKS